MVTFGQVELRRVGQVAIDRSHLLLRHADAAVLDLDREAAATDVTQDAHGRVRRGEDGRVLGKLGDQVNDVGHSLPRQRSLGAHQHPDPGVVLHLGHGGPEHVVQRYWVLPPASGQVAGQDDEALGVTAHARRQVIDTEQLVEFLGLLGFALHPVQ